MVGVVGLVGGGWGGWGGFGVVGRGMTLVPEKSYVFFVMLWYVS